MATFGAAPSGQRGVVPREVDGEAVHAFFNKLEQVP
jgi:hypothetical protein